MITQNGTTAPHAGEDHASAVARTECWSTDQEQFNSESLSGLVMAYDWLRAGDIVYVADKVSTALSRLIDADDIIEMLHERAADVAGEGAEDYPDVTEDEKKTLEAAIHGWIAMCCPPKFWGVENVRKHVLTEADLNAVADAEIGGEQ